MRPPFEAATNPISPRLYASHLKKPIPTNAWWTNFLLADGHGLNLGYRFTFD